MTTHTTPKPASVPCPANAARTHVRYVVDTSVMLDCHSIHGLLQEIRAAQAKGGRPFEDEMVRFRRARMRDALLLAMHFSDSSITTLALSNLQHVLEQKAPLGLLDHVTYLTDFIEYIAPHALPGWDSRPCADSEEGGLDLVEQAAALDVPLVSHVGTRLDGRWNPMVIKASELGVRLLRPREIFEGLLDEDARCRVFLERFAEAIPPNVVRPGSDGLQLGVGPHLRAHLLYLQLILLGIGVGARWPLRGDEGRQWVN